METILGQDTIVARKLEICPFSERVFIPVFYCLMGISDEQNLLGNM